MGIILSKSDPNVTYPRESTKAFDNRMKYQYEALVNGDRDPDGGTDRLLNDLVNGYDCNRFMKKEYDMEVERVFEGV